MKTMTMALMVAVMGLVFLVSEGSAHAVTCTSGSKLAQYKTGKKIGEMIVQQAWLSVDEDPTRFEEVADAVRDAVGIAIDNLAAGNPSDLVLCRAKGLAQGVCDGLDDLQDKVEGICLLDGEAWGELAASLYCDLSIAFGGPGLVGLLPSAPASVCGTSFEESCEDTFADLSAGDATCDDFTVAPFALVFAESQANLCVFEVEE